ncbi:MAG: ComF family protein [Candidatus Pacebacteria bacterium]|nr:ComF family protein [Candidatus Paceibacterota bacterium]
MLSLFSKAKEIFLDILFPPLCLSCRHFLLKEERQKNICRKCAASVILNSSLFCPVCHSRLPIFSPSKDMEKNFPRLNCHKDCSFFLASASSFSIPVIRNLIHLLKFGKIPFASNFLSEIMIIYFKSLNLEIKNYSVIPIPLSKKRLKERGFNQSELLAKKFCSAFCLPLLKNLIRSSDRKPQSETKNRAEREQNIKNCFAVINASSLAEKNIILIDDVFTTGSTAKEAVKILKKAGVNKIIFLTPAKT